MNKRGQVFILAAMLIAVILFSLAAIKNKSEQEEIRGDFEALSENFKIESSKLINSVVNEGGDAHKEFKEFSTMFTAYAKGKNPEYGLIYIFNFGDNLIIANFLDREITIQDECEYSITINGSFSKVPASLSFENFDIGTSIVWGDIESECIDLGTPSGDEEYPRHFCANITTIGPTDFQVIIDGIGYYHCAEKGVPELMQVSKMKQGEQAKVSSSGKCINQNYCDSFNVYSVPSEKEYNCEHCSGEVCFPWEICGGEILCLSKYAYPARVSDCDSTCDQFCLGNKIFYKDTCGNPIGTYIEECDTDEVCRGAQCCIKKDSKDCCGDDICWFSSCGTQEGRESCETGFACQEPDTGAQCCDLDAETRCVENDIYDYSSCGFPGSTPVLECNEEGGWICRDPYYTGGGTLPDTAVCCSITQNTQTYCCGDDVCLLSSCGTDEGLVTRCMGQNRACRDANPARCCKLNDDKQCFDGDVYWYSDCGTRESLKEDCGTAECENGECVIPVYEQFKCERRAYIYIEHYECDDQVEADCHCQYYDCNTNNPRFGPEATAVNWDEDGDECVILCAYPVWTDCLENPSCGSYPFLGEQTCQP